MSSKKITLAQLKHVAKLAKLKLTKEEENKYLSQLSSILDYFDILNKVDTTNIEPSFQITQLKNIFRQDKVKPSLDQSQALSTASKTKNNYFSVPLTIDK